MLQTRGFPRADKPGLVALFGSGETSASGRRVHEFLMAHFTPPVAVAILESPAGFQPNVEAVSAGLRRFLEDRLPSHKPVVTVVPARRRGGWANPNSPQVAHWVLPADYIFAGPGSPTYAARCLRGTLTWRLVCQRHREGAILGFASAAAMAIGAHVLPVYEIYKAGTRLHWLPGLDLFGPHGFDLTVVTHWNNQEGGATLDTSCGFVGAARFERLQRRLPASTTVLGIDEHTACVIDLGQARCQVIGRGGVVIRRAGGSSRFEGGQTFPLRALGGDSSW